MQVFLVSVACGWSTVVFQPFGFYCLFKRTELVMTRGLLDTRSRVPYKNASRTEKARTDHCHASSFFMTSSGSRLTGLLVSTPGILSEPAVRCPSSMFCVVLTAKQQTLDSRSLFAPKTPGTLDLTDQQQNKGNRETSAGDGLSLFPLCTPL